MIIAGGSSFLLMKKNRCKQNSRIQNSRFIIYVDGSSRGNPGPAGIGIAVFKDRQTKEPFKKISRFIGYTTNNVAEYEAVIEALKWVINSNALYSLIVLDSELVFNQITGQYRARAPHIQRLLDRLNRLKNRARTIKFKLVVRKKNRWANQLAQKASKQGLKKAQPKEQT